MEELMKAVALVLEWHDENLSDGVNREYAIRELRQAYEAAQQSVHLTASGAGGRGQIPLQSSFIADDPSAKIGGR